MVERLGDKEEGVQKLAIESIRNEIRTATTSMTSVPKPLKFLRPKYDEIKQKYEENVKGGRLEYRQYNAKLLVNTL